MIFRSVPMYVYVTLFFFILKLLQILTNEVQYQMKRLDVPRGLLL